MRSVQVLLEHAKALLTNAAMVDRRITDIAFDCGFADGSHFNRSFRGYFGDSPSGMRNRGMSQ